MTRFFLSSVLFLVTISACAQHLPASKIPDAVKAGFGKVHPGTHPKWEKEDGNFEASYKQGGHDMSCVIDTHGTILETETDIAVTALPRQARDYIKMHYRGQKIKEASKIEKQDGKVGYEAVVNGIDVMFDADGKFLKEIKEAND